LSKATLKNIYLNFFWAFAYNVVMIPLAAFGLLNPSLAGIGMGFSSIMVVLNALSLKLYKFKTKGE
jgi:Cu+-exporting ATPase